MPWSNLIWHLYFFQHFQYLLILQLFPISALSWFLDDKTRIVQLMSHWGIFIFFHQLLVSLSIFKFNILLQLFSSILKLIFLGRGNLWCDQGPCLNKVHSICHPFYERSCWSRLLFHNYSKHCCVPKRSQSQLCFQISSPVFHWWQVLVQVSWCFAWSSSIPVFFRRLTHID